LLQYLDNHFDNLLPLVLGAMATPETREQVIHAYLPNAVTEYLHTIQKH